MKTLKYLSLLIALVAFNQIFVLTPGIPQNLYYGIFAFSLIFGILLSKKLSLNPSMVLLLFATVTSLAINDVPAFFMAPLRLFTFVLVLSLIGPIIHSDSMAAVKTLVFYRLNRFITIASAFSFLVYFGLPVPQFGGFSGFFVHSMVLGPMAGISLLLIIHILIGNHENISKKLKIFGYIAFVFCFLALLLASSRAAIAATVAGMILFLYKYYQVRFSKFLSSVLFVTMLFIITFPVWSDYTEGIQKKTQISQGKDDFASSRRSFWDSRLEEFKESPVFGIGFATLDISKKGSSAQTVSGSIEPGSSWLAILSMTGVLGFIPVLFIFLTSLKFLLTDKINPSVSALLGGLLIFFITHMFAEGYIFASGSFLFLYVWLLLGVIEVYKYNPYLKLI